MLLVLDKIFRAGDRAGAAEKGECHVHQKVLTMIS